MRLKVEKSLRRSITFSDASLHGDAAEESVAVLVCGQGQVSCITSVMRKRRKVLRR